MNAPPPPFHVGISQFGINGIFVTGQNGTSLILKENENMIISANTKNSTETPNLLNCNDGKYSVRKAFRRPQIDGQKNAPNERKLFTN